MSRESEVKKLLEKFYALVDEFPIIEIPIEKFTYTKVTYLNDYLGSFVNVLSDEFSFEDIRFTDTFGAVAERLYDFLETQKIYEKTIEYKVTKRVVYDITRTETESKNNGGYVNIDPYGEFASFETANTVAEMLHLNDDYAIEDRTRYSVKYIPYVPTVKD